MYKIDLIEWEKRKEHFQMKTRHQLAQQYDSIINLLIVKIKKKKIRVSPLIEIRHSPLII